MCYYLNMKKYRGKKKFIYPTFYHIRYVTSIGGPGNCRLIGINVFSIPSATIH